MSHEQGQNASQYTHCQDASEVPAPVIVDLVILELNVHRLLLRSRWTAAGSRGGSTQTTVQQKEAGNVGAIVLPVRMGNLPPSTASLGKRTWPDSHISGPLLRDLPRLGLRRHARHPIMWSMKVRAACAGEIVAPCGHWRQPAWRKSTGAAIAAWLAQALLLTHAAAQDRQGGVMTGQSLAAPLRTHEIRSKVLDDTRRLLIWLPVTYSWDTKRHYPVLYALDGQELFDAATAAGGEEWLLDELLVRQPEGVRETIVVGVVAGPHGVAEQATPGSRPDAGGAAYCDFLAGEVKPFIDATYRTQEGRHNAWLLGLGNSAALAIFAAWTRADLFGGAIALELPDLDASHMSWTDSVPKFRPWLWLEQKLAEKSRPSTTQLLADLEAHADVQLVMTTPRSTRPARLAAALRGIPTR